MDYREVFSRLWEDYTKENPHAQQVFDLFTAYGEVVENDHIAFRTLNDSRINIDVLSVVFQQCGFELKGDYFFEEKHLYARHFEHSTLSGLPRVFISQLILEDFSDFLKSSLIQVVDQIPKPLLSSEELIFSGVTWDLPSYEIYQKLREESEYAAWFYVWGFRANHFTVSVNSLKKLDSVEKVNAFLKDHGFALNDSGGEIKGTPAELLEQSSTKAGIVTRDFKEGKFEVPSCYYEFARRYPDKNGLLYSGFIAKSADKIFESTNFYRK